MAPAAHASRSIRSRTTVYCAAGRLMHTTDTVMLVSVALPLLRVTVQPFAPAGVAKSRTSSRASDLAIAVS